MNLRMLFKSSLLAMLTVGLFSCSDSKNDEPDNNEPQPLPSAKGGAYFLNQGQMSLNIEGMFSFLDYKDYEMNNNVFVNANHRSLGNTPQCGIRYGSKIYLGVYESNTIEILDASTFVSLKQLNLTSTDTGTHPRAMVSEKGKVYITMFDGYVARLDTLSLEIDGRVKVGPNPETPAILNNKLYVPNSDGMNWEVGYGTTASIIDLNTFTVESTVNVPLNPNTFMAVKGHLYLLAKGNYGNIAGAVYEIDPSIVSIQANDPEGGYRRIVNATEVYGGNNVWVYMNCPYDQPDREYGRYDVSTETLTKFTAEEVIYPNAIAVDPKYGYIYITSYIMDGVYPSYIAPGFVTMYDSNLKYRGKFDIGAGPTTIFF